jgi:hypothetical protein
MKFNGLQHLRMQQWDLPWLPGSIT